MTYILRPLSPHLVVYKTQVTSLFSIFHRISGALNVLLLAIFLLFFYFSSQFFGFSFFFLLFYNLSSTLALIYYPIILFFFYTFLFHLFNGLRHLSWDFCIGLKVEDLSNSAQFVILCIFIIHFFLFIF